MERFFVTTPIYYVNDVPHLGHTYTSIVGDTLARFHRVMGREVFYLTGTDEHGQKIEKAAEKRGITPQLLVDEVVERFKGLWTKMGVQYDYFIRTSDELHVRRVQRIFQRLLDKGDIYKGTYTGNYCVSCELYIGEDSPVDAQGNRLCPDCGRVTETLSEEVYFFRLSAYTERLLRFYRENPGFVVPEGRMNEVVSFVSGGLRDLSITRSTVKWGIPVPGDPSQTIYVWFDALFNYLTALGYTEEGDPWKKWWPAQVQLIGKDILRFHAVFWPAFLMAVDLEPPKKIVSHGWWLVDKEKMSKSKGNALNPEILMDKVGPDGIRYFLLREIPLGIDGNFSHEGFFHRVNSDLANDLGNLVNRIGGMTVRYFPEGLTLPKKELDLEKEYDELRRLFVEDFEECRINRALEKLWGYINLMNRYIVQKEPWKLSKEGKNEELRDVLASLLIALRGVGFLLYPAMPFTAGKILASLGVEKTPSPSFGGLREGLPSTWKLQPLEPLFPRVDVEEFLAEKSEIDKEKKEKMEEKREEKREEKTAPAEAQPPKELISIDEFRKAKMVVAQILEVNDIEGADKLYRLKIDLGTEIREILGGIKLSYSREELVGKKLIVLTNLEPRKIRGFVSSGMLLAANVEGKATIAFFPEDVPVGTPIT